VQQLSLSNLAINKGKTPEATRQLRSFKPRVVKMQAKGTEQIKAKKKIRGGKLSKWTKEQKEKRHSHCFRREGIKVPSGPQSLSWTAVLNTQPSRVRPTALNCFRKRELGQERTVIIYGRIVVRVVGHYGVHGLGEKLIVVNSCVERCICLEANLPIIPIASAKKRRGGGR